MTDLAARGLDIPLLDNINFSFPAKGKLFLHGVGHVARAIGSGTAYCVVAGGLGWPSPELLSVAEEQPGKEEGESMGGHLHRGPGPKLQPGAKRWKGPEFLCPLSAQGLPVNGPERRRGQGTSEQQVAGAVLDLMGDEAQNLTRGRQRLKRDGRKKQFEGQSGQEDKKMVKTERGHSISSSYKPGLCQKWEQKQKVAIHSTPDPK